MVRLLLIQDNPRYAAALRKRLTKGKDAAFDIKDVATLREAIDYLAAHSVDIILLELSLPDAKGLEAFEKIQSVAPLVPVVILTSLTEEITALRAVQKGAQDYLLKTQDESKLLLRVIRCAMERQRVQKQLISFSYLDDLTGLYNRRGFSMLAEQQIKFARRSKKGFQLFLLDMDGFKQINDVYGHIQGDFALAQAAQLLKKTFRESDLLARIGGDEFAVVAIEAGRDTAAVMYQRLDKVLEEYHLVKTHAYRISLSAGAAYFDPENPVPFEQLFETADSVLYQHKRTKSRQSS